MNNSLKYFFNRSFEILHRKSFDSYRLSLNNPHTIFIELSAVINQYKKKRVRNFNPTISDVGVEALDLIKNEFLNDLLNFGSFTKDHIKDVLNENCEKNKNKNKIRSIQLIAKTIEFENKDFKLKLINQLIQLLIENDDKNFDEIDTLTGWLFSELHNIGFSKDIIERNLRACGNKVYKNKISIQLAFNDLNKRFDYGKEAYTVYFKLKTLASEPIKLTSDDIEAISSLPQNLLDSNYLNSNFKEKQTNEYFFKVALQAHDFWSALEDSFLFISEAVEINFLHNSENKVILENQAISIHDSSGKYRVESIEQKIDGFYLHNETQFDRFIKNYKQTESKSNTAHEKLRAAIRFYKLGNQSVDMEHKILNYWIGFEQLYSAVDSEEDSITRMKSFFSALNGVYYIQRKVNYLIQALNRNEIKFDNKSNDRTLFKRSSQEVKTLVGNPLYTSRLLKYHELFVEKNKIGTTIELHDKRLKQHLTRIYRVRNELVHEGKTAANARIIAGHLRHYLLFSIEQITNELVENESLQQIDDVFVYYENLLANIKKCKKVEEIYFCKNYFGYME